MSLDLFERRAASPRDLVSSLACVTTTLVGLGVAAILLKALIGFVS